MKHRFHPSFFQPFATTNTPKFYLDPTSYSKEFTQQARDIGKLPQSPGKGTFVSVLNKATFDAAPLNLEDMGTTTNLSLS